jgi:cation diffusion facilitator family transporter
VADTGPDAGGGDALRRAQILQYLTVVHIIASAVILYVTLGTSQAMKSAFLDDLIGIVPPIAFLIAARWVNRPPSSRFPYGYHRARSVAFVLAALSIVLVALFIILDGVLKLIQRHHPPIRSTEMFGATVWSGWPMLVALFFAAAPRWLLGRMKLPIGRQLNDKVLFAEAAMNRADWLAAVAAGVGVVGIGLGWWWADSVAATVIGVDIFHEGVEQMRRVTGHLLGETPRQIDSDEDIDVAERVEERIRSLDWVEDVRTRLREEGTVFFAEVFVVPRDDEVRVDDVLAVQAAARDVDDQLVDVVVMPVDTIDDAPHHRGAR